MRFFKIGRTLIVAVVFAISLVGGYEQFSEQAAVVWAEVMPFTGAGVSVQGTHGGTGEIAKEGAKMSAIQAAQDQAGIYVSSLSVMKNSSLSQDEIATIVSDVVRVDEKNIKYETSILGDSDVQVVKYRASVTVYIDTDSLKKNIDAWRQKEEEKRQILVIANANNRKSIVELNRDVSDAENMIKRGAEKADIQMRLTEIERKTLAMKKNKEGNELYMQGNYQEAMKLYNEAIQIKPDFSWPYNNRGGIYLTLGNYQQAINEYNKAIELDHKNAFSYGHRGSAYYELGNKKQAIADYNKAIELDPKSEYAYIKRGIAYSNLGNKEQAIADYSKAIEINPKQAAAYNNRGRAYLMLGNYRQAIDDCTKAIELNPKAIELNQNFAYSYNIRGYSYYCLGNKKQAIADYTKAIELYSKFAQAYYNRGICYKELGNIDKANADFAKAKELGYKAK